MTWRTFTFALADDELESALEHVGCSQRPDQLTLPALMPSWMPDPRGWLLYTVEHGAALSGIVVTLGSCLVRRQAKRLKDPHITYSDRIRSIEDFAKFQHGKPD